MKAGRLTIKTKLPSGLSCACVRLGFAQPRIAHYLLSALAASSGEFVSFAPWYRPASRSAQEPTKKTTLISQREPSSTVLMRAEQHPARAGGIVALLVLGAMAGNVGGATASGLARGARSWGVWPLDAVLSGGSDAGSVLALRGGAAPRKSDWMSVRPRTKTRTLNYPRTTRPRPRLS